MTPSFILKAMCVGFLGGITSGLIVLDNGLEAVNISLLLLCFAIAIGATMLILARWRVPLVEGILLAVVGLALGFSCVGIAVPGEQSINYLVETSEPDPVAIAGTIQKVSYGERQQVTVNSVQINGASKSGKLLVSLPAIPEQRVGDKIQLDCTLELPEPFDGFRYDKYLSTKHVHAVCFRPSGVEVFKHESFNPARLRYLVIDGSERLLGEPHAALLSGLLIGEKRFTEIWEERFVATGTSHIVAASGYNVTILSYLLFGGLIAAGFYRKQAVLLVMLCIGVYVLISGGDPPVLRAGIMGSIVIFSTFLGRSGSVTNILLLTACLMLAISPGLLFYDVGFQLSFLSTIGLIYLSPTLENYLSFFPEAYTIRESVTATVAATLATLPIILSQFGVFSLASLPVNLLILPFVPFTMAGGAISIALFHVLDPIGLSVIPQVVIAPTWLMLEYMTLVIQSVASIPGVTIGTSISVIIQVLLWIMLLLWLHKATTQSRSYL